jgi:hypothetical protein
MQATRRILNTFVGIATVHLATSCLLRGGIGDFGEIAKAVKPLVDNLAKLTALCRKNSACTSETRFKHSGNGT